ncbi:MAG: magnesium transporter [Verrucomicrobia bacterium]|nr:magnesium transporter [Verrucomicrobiota bacterium]
MLLLSNLARFEVHLASGEHRRASVVDFAIDLLADDHPPVTRIYLRTASHGATRLALPWEAVAHIDWVRRIFHVHDLAAAQAVAPQDHAPPAGTSDVLLHRDILDALILDLQNRRATRANDLALRLDGKTLRLCAADVSLRAMLRRITGGRAGRGLVEEKLYDWKYVEFLRGDPSAVQAGAGYHRRIARLPAGEIARLADALPYLHAAELVTLLPDKLAVDALEAMSAARQLQVFEELDEPQQLALLNLMAPDLAADLVGRLRTEAARTLLNRLSPTPAERLTALLRFPEDSTGGIMTNDVLTVPASLTVAEARAALRERLREPDFIFFIYVVEDESSRRLRGVLTLRTLVTAAENRRVDEVMNPYLITLRALTSAQDAAYRVLSSHLAALPVVGREGQLLGAVTIDAAVAQVAPASWTAQAPRVFS